MNKMLKLAAFALLIFCVPSRVRAQEPAKESKSPDSKSGDAKSADAKPADAPKEESAVTDHSIRIGGQPIPYKATASTILLKDDKGEPTASLFSMAYTRSDVKDLSQRPLAFVYNGGPGSSSIWLHMGAFGPRRVVTTEVGGHPSPALPARR